MSAEELCECEYDEIRLKNIRERRALFQELGIEDAKAECKKGISKTSKRSYTEETPTERTRKPFGLWKILETRRLLVLSLIHI